jgi:hypothetical protein
MKKIALDDIEYLLFLRFARGSKSIVKAEVLKNAGAANCQFATTGFYIQDWCRVLAKVSTNCIRTQWRCVGYRLLVNCPYSGSLMKYA